MNLLDIKTYMCKVKTVSLLQLAAHFDTKPDVARQMLGHWIRKGKVRQRMQCNACIAKCFKYNMESNEVYEWVYHSKQPYKVVKLI
tara:strand:+ start:811 stop:1068 length:258 start_codon:yes stop_codon:yes gene_type:complete